jgi:hypothetical protein
MTLPHVLLMTIGTTGLNFLFGWLLSRAGLHTSFVTLYWLSFPLAFAVMLLLAWPISRLFRLRPLMIFSGPCPGCRTRPSGWLATPSGPARLEMICGACGERLELWLMRRPPAGLVPGTVPTYRLCWPEFLGIWCKVPSQDVGGTVGIT